MKLNCIVCLLLAAWMMLMANYAQAELWVAKAGGDLHETSLIRQKFTSFAYENKLTQLLDYRLELGVMQINRDFTGFLSPSVGLVTQGTGIYGKVFFGPAVVTNTSDSLSTHVQFNTDFELGIRDARGLELGVGFKHMSNAGLGGANTGKDIFYIKIGF